MAFQITDTGLVVKFGEELRSALPGVDIRVYLKDTGYYGAILNVVAYECKNDKEVYTAARKLLKAYKGQPVGNFVKRYNKLIDGEWQTVESAPWTVPLYDFEVHLRQKQTGVKVTGATFRKVLKDFEDPGDGEIVFGEIQNGDGYYRRKPKQILEIGIRKDGSLNIYFVDPSGLLITFSKFLTAGGTSQDFLRRFRSVKFQTE